MGLAQKAVSLDEVGGKYIKLVCAPDKIEHAIAVLRKRGRVSSLRKDADRIEVVAHVNDISWAELDALISRLSHIPFALSRDRLDRRRDAPRRRKVRPNSQ